MGDRNPSRPNRKNRRGIALPMMALLIAVLLAFAGLVLDGGRLYFEKRKMQAAADAGAFAGAHEVKRGNTGRVDIASKEDARLNSYEHGVGTIQIDVNNPPLSGEFQNNGFVEVVIQQEIPTYFMRVLNFNQATVRARAVAGLLAYSDLCLLALDPDGRAALRVTGTPRLEADCGVMVNSDNDRAIEVNGSGELISQWIGTAGQARTAGGGLMIPSIAEYALPMTDPFAARTEPVAANYPLSPTAGLAASTISTDTVLQPGLYPTQISITNGTVTFLPGQYYLTRGLSATGGALLGEGGVGFFNYNERGNDFITITATAEAHLVAASTVPSLPFPQNSMQNILFWARRTSGDREPGNLIRGTADSSFTGALYFSDEHLDFAGSSDTTGAWALIVAKSVDLSGTSGVQRIEPPPDGTFPELSMVTLVE